MIKLCLPISSVDSALASNLAQRFAQYGDMRDREILVSMCWEDSVELNLDRFVAFLRPQFKAVQVYVMPDVPEGEGWPMAANHMFYQSMAWLAQNGNQDPIYFFEADNFPLRRGWLQAFDDEYQTAGKPYMGVVQPSHYLNKRTGEIITRGNHMVGTGIYPADFMERCKGVHTLDRIAWDMELAEEIIPECHHTNLIHHAWNTHAYQAVEGELIGQDVPGVEKRFGLNVDKITGLRARGGKPVPKEALVIHGCKDLSLYAIDIPS